VDDIRAGRPRRRFIIGGMLKLYPELNPARADGSEDQ
jgi:hypothetical protein